MRQYNIVNTYSKMRQYRGCVMQNKTPRYTLRIDRHLLDRLQYIAKYEGRTANKQLEQLVKKCISEFENANGKITDEMISELYANK